MFKVKRLLKLQDALIKATGTFDVIGEANHSVQLAVKQEIYI